jgi:hypothetical protein
MADHLMSERLPTSEKRKEEASLPHHGGANASTTAEAPGS